MTAAKVGRVRRWNCLRSEISHRGFGWWLWRKVPFRVLALVNVALIPYVWMRFPREAWPYAKRSIGAVLRGR